MAKAKREDFDPRLLGPIAHRGLHDESISENSLKAFEKAIELGIPFECDVHLSKDGHPIICHDANLKRVCGKEGYIPGLSLKEIKESYRLFDGQEVPTLEEALSLNGERVPQVVELKVDDGNQKELVKVVLKTLESIKNKKAITLISFNPLALLKAKKSPYTRGLLVCLEHPFWLKTLPLFDYLDIDVKMLPNKKIEKYRKKGGLVNTWTINKEEHISLIKGRVDALTFELMPLDKAREAL